MYHAPLAPPRRSKIPKSHPGGLARSYLVPCGLACGLLRDTHRGCCPRAHNGVRPLLCGTEHRTKGLPSIAWARTPLL